MRNEDTPDKKQEIMKVATDLLLNNSYAKVNMSTIAEACGITKAGIYYHFKNKETLIRECLKSTLADVNSILYNHCSESVSVRDKLRVISLELFAMAEGNPGMLTLFLRSITEPELRVILTELHDDVDMFIRELGEIIRFGFNSGEVRPTVDPFMAARMLAGTFLMQMQSAFLLRKKEVFEHEAVVDLLFDGIAVR